MSNNIQGGVKPGATSVSIPIILNNGTSGAPLTGKTAADITAYYYRQGAADEVSISLSDLAAPDSAWAAGGWKELDAVNMPGAYRLDLPDAALATGADWLHLVVFASDSRKFHETWPLGPMPVTLGAGAVAWTYTVTSSTTGLALADVDVWITTDAAGQNVIASGRTNQAGVVTFYLDSGSTVYVWCSKAGYNFTNPDTEVVS